MPINAKLRTCLNRFIQGPGRGRALTSTGNAATSRYGSARPMPNAEKISMISNGPCARANPTALPRNGAEQGVASSVANAPWRNCPERPCPPFVPRIVINPAESRT